MHICTWQISLPILHIELNSTPVLQKQTLQPYITDAFQCISQNCNSKSCRMRCNYENSLVKCVLPILLKYKSILTQTISLIRASAKRETYRLFVYEWKARYEWPCPSRPVTLLRKFYLTNRTSFWQAVYPAGWPHLFHTMHLATADAYGRPARHMWRAGSEVSK